MSISVTSSNHRAWLANQLVRRRRHRGRHEEIVFDPQQLEREGFPFTRPSHLLVIRLGSGRHTKMEHESDVRLVDAEEEGSAGNPHSTGNSILRNTRYGAPKRAGCAAQGAQERRVRGDVYWRYDHQQPDDLRVCCGPVNRGVAISGDAVLMATLDARILAFNRLTGEILWDTPIIDYRDGYAATSAPLVVGDLAVIGVAGGEYGIRGFFDATRSKRDAAPSGITQFPPRENQPWRHGMSNPTKPEVRRDHRCLRRRNEHALLNDRQPSS